MKTLRSLAAFLLAFGAISAALAWRVDPPADSPEVIVASQAAPEPKYWKGNLHTHSLWSDGDDFPEMIADWYQSHGYNFLTMSDHNILSEGQRWIDAKKREVAMEKYLKRFGPAWVEQKTENDKAWVRLKPLAEFRTKVEEAGRFLMIQGEEITHRFAKLPVHLGGINLQRVIVPLNGDSAAETIQVNVRSVSEQEKKTGVDMLTILNHPNYGWAMKAEDIARADELRFFEIYNGHPGVNNYGDANRIGVERMWDIALALRLGKLRTPLLLGVATDDAHSYHKYGVGSVNPGRGWIMVKAKQLTPDAIVRGINAGDFYMSTGVTLGDIRREGDKVSFSIKGEPGVKYKTEFIATAKDAPLDSKPHIFKEKDKDVETTGYYSDEIGKVAAETESLTPSFRLTGKELYVRARITSTKSHPNPFKKGDVEMAWTQPVVP